MAELDGLLNSLQISRQLLEAIIVVAAIAAVSAFLIAIIRSKARRRPRAYQEKKSSRQPRTYREQYNRESPWKRPDISDPAEQMKAISLVEFETRRLLNKEEVPILKILEKVSQELNGGFRVMAQTSLGELIGPRETSGLKYQRELAFRSINSKRLDFSVIDNFGRIILAVEYQGSGHYTSTSFMRDAVKREALRKAGVPFLEIPKSYDSSKIAEEIKSILANCSRPRNEIGQDSKRFRPDDFPDSTRP